MVTDGPQFSSGSGTQSSGDSIARRRPPASDSILFLSSNTNLMSVGYGVFEE